LKEDFNIIFGDTGARIPSPSKEDQRFAGAARILIAEASSRGSEDQEETVILGGGARETTVR